MIDLLRPEWLAEVWAKSPAKKGIPGQSLSGHTWQVLRRLAEMARLRPRLPEMVGFPGLWHALFWGCLLHDLGKSANGFQAWLRGGPPWPHRHEILSLSFLSWLEGTFSREEEVWAAAAIAYHHKDSQEISLRYMGSEESSAEAVNHLISKVDKSVLEGLWRWLAGCAPAWIEALGLSPLGVRKPVMVPLETAVTQFQSAGAEKIIGTLRALRRWERELRRSRKEALIVGALALRGHMITSDHTASAHAGSFSQVKLSDPNELLSRWQITEKQLYPHQKTCRETNESAVLIAPTGSGKTEAAILWACAQSEGEAPLPRLFYTLPYQASMNAMYDRLRLKCFPGQVGLEHSRSTLALYRRFLEDGADRAQALKSARWEKQLSRLNYFPVRVLSPYQMLKGPFRLKGYESLFTDYLGAAFIFDEMHAYDVKRMAAILATVNYLRENLGARFLVMSATLPGILQHRICKAINSKTVLKATPEVFKIFQRHRLELCEGDLLEYRWMELIVKDIKQGLSVLVCCNTVKRAQKAYQELSSRLKRLNAGVETLLLHGRFHARDRLYKESVVQAASGSSSEVRRPLVLVSTQVVEVSLDIDLDIIYTDPAPLEALIQRFGRINRRLLKARAPVKVFTEPKDGQQVYDDELINKSLSVLHKNAEKIINEEEISGWLDEIYLGETASRWNQLFDVAYEEFESACLRTLRPFESSENLEELFYRAFDSIEVLPACLESEYNSLVQSGDPLEAGQLLVPLSWKQFCILRRKGAVHSESYGRPRVVEVPYSSENGLII